MYEFFSKISNLISDPLFNAAQTDIAMLAALFLGFVGSVVPCQISANAAAMMYFGNRHKCKHSFVGWKSFYIWQVKFLCLAGSEFCFTYLEENSPLTSSHCFRGAESCWGHS
jgi:cytochrome c-type biogenesis protein